MLDLERMRTVVKTGSYEISRHARRKMKRLRLTEEDVENAILTGEIIERRPNAKPYPKYIISGFTFLKGDLIHIVFSFDHEDPFSKRYRNRVVTIYYVEENKWYKDRYRRINGGGDRPKRVKGIGYRRVAR
ncbi:MAG: DUF4258 domain-containing protein [bacterium]